jgi:hypothetical protein
MHIERPSIRRSTLDERVAAGLIDERMVSDLSGNAASRRRTSRPENE